MANDPIKTPPKPEFVGIKGGTQHTRTNGIEDRDWKHPAGQTIYRVTLPGPNPQEAAVANAAKRKSA